MVERYSWHHNAQQMAEVMARAARSKRSQTVELEIVEDMNHNQIEV
jgi:hypothetical protein